MNNINSSVGNTSVGEVEHVLYGKSTITENLRGLTFQISANSFFQTNTCQVYSNLFHRLAHLEYDDPIQDTDQNLFRQRFCIG